MEDEEDSTLSTLFKSLLRGSSPLANHSKPRHSNTVSALQRSQEAEGTKISAEGDIVWAKASPFTWRPAQVRNLKGSLLSISFFGCNKTRCFNCCDILGFEEAYPRMVRMAGGKLSYEIGLALDELARGVAMGLKCCCRVSDADGDRLLAAKRGFDSGEVFCFLVDKAVLPRVFEEEIATVVRVSAALNAFRYGLVLCNTSEVDEGFCAEGVLDFVLDVAVNLCVDDKAVAQLRAFRRFASVKPAWFYQLDWEFEEDGLESHVIGDDLELPDCTSEDELYHGRTADPEVDVLIKPQEECELLDVNYKQEGREMCVINVVDFSIFDTDEKYESLIYDQHQVDADGGQSSGRGVCRNTSHEWKLHSCAEGASGISEVDANESAANVICASVNNELVISLPQNNPNHVIQVGEEVTFDRSIGSHLENATGEENTSMAAQSDKCNYVEVLSSENDLSLRTVPLHRGQLHSLPINKCSIFSPIKVLNLAIKPQSSPEVCFNISNAAHCIALIPEMAPFAETDLQISADKRKLYETATSENYKSLQTSLPSETIAPSKTLMSECISAHVNGVIDKALRKANGGNDAIKLHFSNQVRLSEQGYNVNVVSNLNYPGHSSKPYSRIRRQNHHFESNFKAFYISPLSRDGLHSNNNRLKFLDGNNHRNSPVLLNMKFPKDYTLPSKELLEKKFSVFGPLDNSRTKVFFYTGVGQVVFLHQVDAVVAYNYVTRKRIFGQANVRFWFYKYENCRESNSNIPGAVHSSLNLKPCLKRSCMPELIDNKKNCRVRFTT